MEPESLERWEIEQKIKTLERTVETLERDMAQLRNEPSLPLNNRRFSLKWPRPIQGPGSAQYFIIRQAGGNLTTSSDKDDWSDA